MEELITAESSNTKVALTRSSLFAIVQKGEQLL
jgi:hypothetical protein